MGAAVSIISRDTFWRLWPNWHVQKSSVTLCTYLGQPIKVLGSLNVEVSYDTQVHTLPLPIVEGSRPSLLDWDWLAHLWLDWKSIRQVRKDSLDTLFSEHKALFQDGLGTMQGYEASLHVDPQVVPKYCKAQLIPYAMRAKVEEELQWLVNEGWLELVQYADWAAPIVLVLKKNGFVWLCGDFKVTVNKVAWVDRYPIPRVEGLLSKLTGGQCFSKLDLSQACQQEKLEELFRQYRSSGNFHL